MAKELDTLALERIEPGPRRDELVAMIDKYFNGRLPLTDEGFDVIRKQAWAVIKDRLANSCQPFNEQFLEDHLGKR
ncbi:hypothetical protein [Pseudomonas sp. 91RF]|jgi:hypothetical protein|uniref:hypothetical protein n=1 Tax=Pseudomonas sp. 91RF TaxID=2292261 RepID=UPI0011C3E9F5|nr:hypothetical protein [Pseudomonas sp. 91RF]